MPDMLRDEINAALTRLAVLDDLLQELRSEMPSLAESRGVLGDRIRRICAFLEQESEHLDRSLAKAAPIAPDRYTEVHA